MTPAATQRKENAPSSAAPTRTKPRRPFLIRVGRKCRPWFDRAIARFSLISNEPVLDPRVFPWTSGLEAEWRAIRDEALKILEGRAAIPPLKDISPDHGRIADDPRWRSFFLYGYGHRIDRNCRRAPRTAALVQRLPGLNSAFFSILEPGAHIPRHRGVTKSIFTAHLGLIVPRDRTACRMVVGTQDVNWREGGCLIFDDTYQHEVWNDTTEMRVVLLLQLDRPVRWPGKLLAGFFMGGIKRSAFVREAIANIGDWEDAHRRMESDHFA